MAVYVFEHIDAEGVLRSVFDEATHALAERHIALNHHEPLPAHKASFNLDIWYNNQRVDYQNEIRVWAD